MKHILFFLLFAGSACLWAERDPTRYIFASDFEGNYLKWERMITENPDLFGVDESGLTLKEGYHFVCGGDVTDRSPGGLRLLTTLLKLQERYPDRVTFLVGNRDINKLYLLRYLSPEYMSSEYNESQRDFIAALSPEQRKASKRVLITRWLFHRLNAATNFEDRRVELALLHKRYFSDEEVVDSFVQDVRKDGLLFEYLMQAQVMLLAGENIFVHGAINPVNYGFVTNTQAAFEDLRVWAAELNAWYKVVVSYLPGAEFIEEKNVALNDLLWYGGTGSKGRSVIYARYSDARGNQTLPEAQLRALLFRQGFRRVGVGHTPTGLAPNLFRDALMTFVNVDTSESQNYSLAIFAPEYVEVRGEFPLNLRENAKIGKIRYILHNDQDSPVGMVVGNGADRELVVAPFEGKWILLRMGEHYTKHYRFVSDAALMALAPEFPCQKPLL
jgi:hypothetical protein